MNSDIRQHISYSRSPIEEVRYLIQLLDDEDQFVYEAVRRRIQQLGPSVTYFLEANFYHEDPLIRKRCRQLFYQIQRTHAEQELISLCLEASHSFDLEKALLLLSQIRYPRISTEGYIALLDEYIVTIKKLLPTISPVLTTLVTLNEWLFKNLGFKGIFNQETCEANYYLCKALDTHQAHTTILCALYFIIARRLRLPVTPIDLNGEVIVCRFQTARETLYIDLLNQGRLITQIDCVRYLHHLKDGYPLRGIQPLTPKQLMTKICEHLIKFYYNQNKKSEALRISQYIIALRS